MTTVLVTGGAGYVGAHACKALANAGFTPVTYDNLSTGHEWAVRWGPFAKGDLLDRDRLSAVFKHYQPSAVMHFAAFAYVDESVEQPLKYYRNNVGGTLNLLAVMLENAVQQIVFSSSCATYGLPQKIPISESHPQNPISPYGVSKLMVERILRDCGEAHGLKSISLRYFNASGADPDGEIGEHHDPETHLIPLALAAAAGTRPHVTIYGTDYDTPDGTCIRDFIHVTDLAEAHVLALKALEKNGPQASYYNLGTGKGFSVRDVIKAASLVTGNPISIQVGPRRPGDPSHLVAEATLAGTELEWMPRNDDLHKIVGTAWNWMLRSNEVRLKEEAANLHSLSPQDAAH